MKSQKDRIKYIFEIIIVILLIMINYTSSIITGKYPYTKRLNNGNYVIVSSRNISFVDSTFSLVYSSKDFDSDMYTTDDELGSTTVSQFSANYNGYVIIILVKKLYIFSSIGEYLNEANTDIESAKFPCYIITHGRSYNNFYFTLIYGTKNDNTNDDKSYNIDFIKITYNSSTKELSFATTIQYPPPNIEWFYPSLS